MKLRKWIFLVLSMRGVFWDSHNERVYSCLSFPKICDNIFRVIRMEIMKITIVPLCKFPYQICCSASPLLCAISVSGGNPPSLKIECQTMCSLSSFSSLLFHILHPYTSFLIRVGIIPVLWKLLGPPWGNSVTDFMKRHSQWLLPQASFQEGPGFSCREVEPHMTM